MDPRILRLYDEYTHAPLPRRVFLERLAALAGGSAAAMAILPLLDSNYANAAIPEDDTRLASGWITYRGQSGDIRGYLVAPRSGPAKRAGVIVVHENRGLTPHIRDVTRRVALEGFNALGVDLLTPVGGTPDDEDKARELYGKIDAARAHLDVVGAVSYLEKRDDAAGPVGAMGFCFGGGVVNMLATVAPSLARSLAVASPIPEPAPVTIATRPSSFTSYLLPWWL